MPSRPRLLIVGLDGATFDLIRPWAAAGELPNITRLMAEGTSAALRSVPNQNSAPAWSSYATGKNPGKHGIYYFNERIAGTYSTRYLNGSFRHGESWWMIASRAGRHAVVINVPMTYPAEAVNGVVLAGLDAPGVDKPGFSHPPELIKDLKARLGPYVIEPGLPSLMKMGRRDLAVEALFDAASKRAAYARHLLMSQPWDVFHVTFTAPDNAHHFFWKDMDPTHPEHDPAEAAVYGDTIRQVYQHMDAIVGELAALAPGAAIMLMSDHGGGFNQRGAEYLNDWLASLGLLHTIGEQPAITDRLRQAAAAPLRWGYDLLDHNLSRAAKLRLAQLLPGLREHMETMLTFGEIDWSRTQAYAYGTRDDIWINLQGREPQGIVPPSQYDALRDQIIAQLYATRDVGDHRPVLEMASKREAVYSGPHLERAPDILVRWKTDRVIRGLYLPGQAASPPEVPPLRPNLNNGGHRLHGIFVMAGPGVRRGHTLVEGVLWDLAPTILHYLGVPIPDDMDGSILQEAFESEWLQSHPVRFAAPGEAQAEAADYAGDEEAIIERRLRGLGYVQ